MILCTYGMYHVLMYIIFMCPLMTHVKALGVYTRTFHMSQAACAAAFLDNISQCCLMLWHTSKNKKWHVLQLYCTSFWSNTDFAFTLFTFSKRVSSILLLAALHCCWLELIALGVRLPPCTCKFLTSLSCFCFAPIMLRLIRKSFRVGVNGAGFWANHCKHIHCSMRVNDLSYLFAFKLCVVLFIVGAVCPSWGVSTHMHTQANWLQTGSGCNQSLRSPGHDSVQLSYCSL